MSKKLTGTKEWAATNLNIATGCNNNCRYCYARHNAVNRFKTVTADDWPKMVVNRAKVNKQYRKRDGVIMFPSSHDIVPEILDEYCTVLKKLLDAGNRVLIVSKPRLKCIRTIYNDVCHNRKNQVEFRFTIGSTNNNILRFWEPEAPTFDERMDCLEFAYWHDLTTSISCEPFLGDNNDIYTIYKMCLPHIVGNFWIGKLNGFNQRVSLDGVAGEEIETFVKPLKELQSNEHIIKLYKDIDRLPLVMWKDSIRKVVEKNK